MTAIPTSTALRSYSAWSCILCWSVDQLPTGIQDVAGNSANSAAMDFDVEKFLFWKTRGSYSTCRMRQKNQLIFLDHGISALLVILSSFVKKIIFFKKRKIKPRTTGNAGVRKQWCEAHTTLLSNIQLHLGSKIEQWKGLYPKTYTSIQRNGQ